MRNITTPDTTAIDSSPLDMHLTAGEGKPAIKLQIGHQDLKEMKADNAKKWQKQVKQ